MDPNEPVSMQTFTAVVGGLLALLQQSLTISTAISVVLVERGVVTPDGWQHAVEQASNSEPIQLVKQAIEALRQKSSIEDIWKDLKGPVQ